ncbi:MAG: aldo/keto reductase [Hyphomicrobiaceae bacterium]
MARRILGRSGLSVSEICLGTMMFGDRTDEPEALRIVDHARDHGVNFIDTADVYAQGRSEEITGRAVKSDRWHWILATKVGSPHKDHQTSGRAGLARRHVMQACDDSLRRLGLDHIDIYYTHRVDRHVPWADVVATFGDLIRAGKIRYWGLSNVRAWHIPEIVHQCRTQSVPQPVVLQPYYNIMTRQPETELIPAARAYDFGIASYSPIARGVLSGKYKPNVAPDPESRAGRGDRRMMEAEWRHDSVVIAEELARHADTRGSTLIEFALAWVLNNRAITSVIAGPRTLEQWQSYLGYARVPWRTDDEAIVTRLVPPGHASTHGHSDPAYPIEGRFPAIA